MASAFTSKTINIHNNPAIREPQIEAFKALESHFLAKDISDSSREVGVILPVGCGKSGCITITPFAYQSKRTLVVAPGLAIAKQLMNDFDPSNSKMFYRKCCVITDNVYPEPAEIRSEDTNQSDLEDSEVVITNIQQLQGGAENKWLQNIPKDFFDLILFDEGHHSVASSWAMLKEHFPNANIVNYSATPLRADGQIMAGKILYSYPIFQAIKNGYVKRLKAVQLNPKSLRFVRQSDGTETEISLAEVKRLGEEDAGFRRSIVTSEETLNTIVDASIQELERLRDLTGERRLKIIASALNYEHCGQVVEAYRARGKKADYVHSRENSDANNRVMDRLEAHELDVIVQVRKLGEGFDHPFLSVAAVFSIFSNLSPFVQFVGRIMRVIEQNSPSSILNQGVVIFHAGANIAKQWSDFQQFSEADQEFFEQLLPLEDFVPDNGGDTRTLEPREHDDGDEIEVRSQSEVSIEEIQLFEDKEALDALKLLQKKGYTEEQINEVYRTLQPIPVTKQRQRQAKRSNLDMTCKTLAAKTLHKYGINPGGMSLDSKKQKTNLILIKSEIDKRINSLVGMTAGNRSEFSRQQLELIEGKFPEILNEIEKEFIDGKH